MKIIIDCGHGLPNFPNSGAKGFVCESTEVRVIGKKVIQHLKQLGHIAIDVTYDKPKSNSDSLNTRVNNANKHPDADIFVSLHLNASTGAGHGVEIFTYDAKQLPSAKRVLQNIVNLGFRDRGIKKGNHLAVIKSTKMPSMLVECFFCDNKADVDRYKGCLDSMAKGIAEGITNQKIDSVDNTETVTEQPIKNSKGETNMTKQEIIDIVKEVLTPSINGEANEHWADESFKSVNDKGVKIHDKKFDDYIKRSEVIALLDRVVK